VRGADSLWKMPRRGNGGKVQPRDFPTVPPALGKSRKRRGISHISHRERRLDYYSNSNPKHPDPKSRIPVNSIGLSLSRGERKSLGDTLADRVPLSCSGLPTGAACNFNPSSVIPNLGGIPVILTISTTGKTSASLFARTNFLWTGLPCLFLLGRRAFRRDRRIILAAILLAVGLSVIACGGGSSSSPAPPNPNPTPSGIYSITVTAADGSVQRTTTFSLTVTGS
jgi:hypothetical protein